MLSTMAGLGVILLLVLWQVRPTYDLVYFLPEPVTVQETVLVERLGQGAGARLIFAEIKAAPGADASAQSAQLKQRLAAAPLFLRVENGQAELSADSIPQDLWRSRYLLSDLDWSEAGMRRELRHRFDDLATLGGTAMARLIAADPLWAAPQVLERLQFGGGGRNRGGPTVPRAHSWSLRRRQRPSISPGSSRPLLSCGRRMRQSPRATDSSSSTASACMARGSRT